MSVIKITAGFACGLPILLLVLALAVKNPETTRYEQTVERLMVQEGLTTEREIEAHFPVLNEIKSKLDQITQLNQLILSKTQGPVPIISEREARKLENYRQRIRELRQGVRTELSLTIATYAKDRP